jgi:hypothetical protein
MTQLDFYGCTLHGAVLEIGSSVRVGNPARPEFYNQDGVILNKREPSRHFHTGYIEVRVGDQVGLFCPCELRPPGSQ